MTGRFFDDLHRAAKKRAELKYFHTAYIYYNLLSYCKPDDQKIAIEFIQLTLNCYLVAKEELFCKQQYEEYIQNRQIVHPARKDTDLSAGERFLEKELGVDLKAPFNNRFANKNQDLNKRMEKIHYLASLGIEKVNGGDYAEGIAEINKAVEMDANCATLIPRAMMFYNYGEIKRAKEDFARALLSDSYRIVHVDIFKKFARNIACAESENLRLDYKSMLTYKDLIPTAVKQLYHKDYQASIQTITAAMLFDELQNDLPIMHSKRGFAHLQLGNYQSALYDYSVSIWLNHPFIVHELPHNPQEDYANLRKTYIGLGDLESAQNTQSYIHLFIKATHVNATTKDKFKYKSMEEHNKDFSYELLDKALHELAQEQFATAKKILELAIKTWPKNIEAAIELSLALRATNHTEQAKTVLESAAKINPSNKRIIYNLKQFKSKLVVEAKTAPTNIPKPKNKKQKRKQLQQQAKKKPQHSTVMQDFVEEKESKAEAELKQIIHDMEIERAKKRTQKKVLKKVSLQERVKEKKAEQAKLPKAAIPSEQKVTPPAAKEHKVNIAITNTDAEKQRYETYIKKIALEKAIMEESFAKFDAARRAAAAGSTPIQIKLDKTEQECLDALAFAGVESYLVGGKVQDHLQNKPFNIRSDIDIVTTASADEIKQAFPNIYQNPYDLKTFTTYVNGVKVDIRQSDALKKSLVDDANTRDFTINAIFADKHGKIYDPTKRGLNDLFLKNGPELNTINKKAADCFSDDPIRLLRALHKQINANVNISESLMKTIQELAPLLKKLDPNLLHSWLLKFLTNNPEQSFQKLIDMKIIDLLFPTIAEILKADQKWITQELQILENRQMACCLHRFQVETHAQIKKPRKPNPNDLYTIFVMSAIKNKIAYQKSGNPIQAVVNENHILNTYFNRCWQDPRIIRPLNKRWDQAHSQKYSNPFNFINLVLPPANSNMYSKTRPIATATGANSSTLFGGVNNRNDSSEPVIASLSKMAYGLSGVKR